MQTICQQPVQRAGLGAPQGRPSRKHLVVAAAGKGDAAPEVPAGEHFQRVLGPLPGSWIGRGSITCGRRRARAADPRRALLALWAPPPCRVLVEMGEGVHWQP